MALIRHAALALGFDLHVLSAQASLLVRRIAIFGVTDPLVALHDELSDRSHPDWSRLGDPVDAASVFVRILGDWLNPAAFAAYMLSECPLSVVEGPLRESICDLQNTPREQRLAAAALAAASSGAVIDEWFADDNPVLREVVASLDELSPDLRRELLSDADRKVRVTALRKHIHENPADLPVIYERVLGDAAVGWMCRGCATTNRPDALSCFGENCFQQAPQLHELALGYRSPASRTHLSYISSKNQPSSNSRRS